MDKKVSKINISGFRDSDSGGGMLFKGDLDINIKDYVSKNSRGHGIEAYLGPNASMNLSNIEVIQSKLNALKVEEYDKAIEEIKSKAAEIIQTENPADKAAIIEQLDSLKDKTPSKLAEVTQWLTTEGVKKAGEEVITSIVDSFFNLFS